jgi:hypothetical protein
VGGDPTAGLGRKNDEAEGASRQDRRIKNRTKTRSLGWDIALAMSPPAFSGRNGRVQPRKPNRHCAAERGADGAARRPYQLN